MSAKPKLTPGKQVDEFRAFRPVAVSSRRSSRSVTPRLLVLSFLTAIFFLSWIFFRPSIGQTVAEIKNVISELGRAPASETAPRTTTPALARKPQHARLGREESVPDTARIPGPFEVYLLDGDRFIHVDASNRSVLLNMKTGETTWMASDGVGQDNRR
ncbi:MAG TPA: hypothetical protein VJ756_20560 [Terriglobales bacterium]|jgi:hypothetical protein|nr:hypothetical protein [Terriglobales bacterium]